MQTKTTKNDLLDQFNFTKLQHFFIEICNLKSTQKNIMLNQIATSPNYDKHVKNYVETTIIEHNL